MPVQISGNAFRAYLECPFKAQQILHNKKGKTSDYESCQLALHSVPYHLMSEFSD